MQGGHGEQEPAAAGLDRLDHDFAVLVRENKHVSGCQVASQGGSHHGSKPTARGPQPWMPLCRLAARLSARVQFGTTPAPPDSRGGKVRNEPAFSAVA